MMDLLETEFSSLYATTLLVFASLIPVLNPFGGSMFFLTLTNGVDSVMRAKMANRIALYSFVILIAVSYTHLTLPTIA